MKAVTYQGRKKVKVKDAEDASLRRKDDILVRVTCSSICGSDLHIYNGEIKSIKDNYIIGHEPVGIVEDVAPEVTAVKKGDRVVIPFCASCGSCFYCMNRMESQCDYANDAKDTGGYIGFGDNYGGFQGAQAELLRVPFGNSMPFIVPENSELEDEKLVLLTDSAPTAFWGVEHAGVKKGHTVIVLGCGPVGLLTQKMAWLKGAGRVIAVDHVEYRLQHAKKTNRVEVYNFRKTKDIGFYLRELTKGGADVVIDCVGLDAKRTAMETIETALLLQGGSLGALRIAVDAVRKFGTIMLVGLYGLNYNVFPLGEMYERNVTLKMGIAPAKHYIPALYEMMIGGKLDPSDIITHRLPLTDAEKGYRLFNEKEDGCIKVILKP